MANDRRPSVEHLDAVFAAMMAQHPDAYIGAIAETGLFTELPEDLPMGQQLRIVGTTSALTIVISDDHRIVLDAWHRVRTEGLANCLVHPLVLPDQLVRFHLIDMNHRYGVYLLLISGMSVEPESLARSQLPVKPRLVTVRKDPAAVIIEADPAIGLVLGWTAEELIGMRTLELLHPDDHKRAIASWMDMLAAPTGAVRRVRLRHLHRDGQPIWFEITNHNLIADPEHQCVHAEMLDISDEMATQEALRAGEQMLRRLTETLPVGVLQIDTDRRIIYQNERVARSLGTTVSDLLDDHLDGVVPGDRPAVDAALASVLRTGGDSDVEYGHRDALLGLRRVNANFRALTGQEGEVTGAIICLADVTEEVRLREELKQRATFDALTGCRNRSSTLSILDQFLAQPGGTAVIFIDLNEFKQVNDRYGHAAGDQLLTYVAGRLRASVREGDIVGRFGGDEFVVVCRGVPDAARARRIAESLLAALDGVLDIDGVRILPQASVGVAWAGPGCLDADALIARADAAMYEAKKGRNGRHALMPAD